MARRDASKRVVVCLLALVFSFITAAYAELTNTDLPDRTGVKVGNDMKLHGSFKTSETLDTNIFLANTNRFIDSITVLSPLGGVEIPFHNGSLSSDYRADIYEYGVHRTEDHVDQLLRGVAEMNFNEFFTATVNDVFNISTDRAVNEDSLRLKQKVNKARAGISGKFNRLIVDAGYTNLLEMYDSTDPVQGGLTYQDKNRDSNIIDTSVSYRFWPKTYAVLENNLGFIHYYNTSQFPGSVYDEALFGFKGEWFAKGNINFKAGLRGQKYNPSSVVSDKPYMGAVMRGGFDYAPTENDALVFEFDREIYESTVANMNFYNANLFGFNWRHNFTKKLYSNVVGSYQLHLYPSATTINGLTAKRQDNFFQGSVGLKYDLRKWIALEAKYEYANKTSNFDLYNYVDNQMTVSGTVGF